MSLAERIAKWLVPAPSRITQAASKPLPEQARAAAHAIAFHSSTRYVGIGSNQPAAALLLQESIGWQDMAARAIANRLASLELQVVRRVRVDGVVKWVEQEDHELAMLLGRPNPMHTSRMMLRLIGQHLVTVGDAYLLKVGNGARVRELHLMKPQNIRPDLVGGVAVAYIVTDGNGAQTSVAAEDVVRIWLPDPETLYTGEGYLGPNAIAADASKFTSETLRAKFEANAIPDVVLEATLDAASPTPEDAARFNDTWRKAYSQRSGSARGLPAMLPSGWTAKLLESKSGADAVPILQFFRDQMLMGNGVPRSILGDVVDANRAAAETNQFVFDLHTVTPLADTVADALTAHLAFPLYGPEIRVRFAPFVMGDKAYELLRERQDLELAVRPINEVRADRALEPVEWGDLPKGTFADAPYTGDAPEPVGSDDPNALDDGDEPRSLRARDSLPRASREVSGGRVTGGARSPADLEWRRVLNRERQFVPRFENGMRKVLRAQQREVMQRLDDAGLGRSYAREITDAEVLEIIARTFGDARWLQLFRATTEPVRKAAFKAAGMDALELSGVSQAFEFTPRVVSILEHQAVSFAQRVNATTLKQLSAVITDALAEGFAEGEALSTRAKRIEQAVGEAFDLRRKHAKTIARTETLRATQKAQTEGYRQSGVVAQKRWNTSRDDAVRDSHRIDGQTVGLDETFRLADGAHATEPGADGLPAEDVINCLLPGTIVSGAFVAGVRSRYHGQAREIHTRSGRCLRVTPNHPVATERGFIPSYKLAEGDYLVGCSLGIDGESVAVGVAAEQEQHAPTAIEQVFDALASDGALHHRQVRADDLHGDGVSVQGDVEIVFAARGLLSDRDSAPAQGSCDLILEEAATPEILGLSNRASALHSEGIDLTAPSMPGRRELPLDGGAARLGPLQPLRFGRAAQIHVALTEGAGQSDTADATFLRELQERHAAAVSLDEITEIRDVEFSGHVYDLQSATGWMVAQGIVVSNCRCFVTPVLEATT